MERLRDEVKREVLALRPHKKKLYLKFLLLISFLL